MKQRFLKFGIAITLCLSSAWASASPALPVSPIDTSLEQFRFKYPDISGLFSNSELRTAAEQKYIELAGLDSPATITKLAAARKKIDAIQKQMRNLLSLQAVQVGPSQFPRLYNIAKRAARALELTDNFHIFVINDPEINALTYSYRTDDYDIVVNSSLIDLLDGNDDALLAIIAHEMGHVKDGAVLYKTALAAEFEARNASTSSESHLAFYDSMFSDLPKLIRSQLQTAALELAAQRLYLSASDGNQPESKPTPATNPMILSFARSLELTADRAAVIATGDAIAPLKALSLLAYGAKVLNPEFNLQALVNQIRTVLTNTEDPQNMEVLVNAQKDHPFNVLRLIEVSDFAASKAFANIKNRLNQDSFGKELDILVRIATQAAEQAHAYKTYLEEKAELDDTLVRLKTTDQFSSNLKRLSAGFNELGVVIIQQIEGSNLETAGNALFDQLIAKMQSDLGTGMLKKALGPAIVGILEKRIATAKDEQAAVELKAKLKRLQDTLEIQ